MPIILISIQINSCVFSCTDILADIFCHQMNSLLKCGSHSSLFRKGSTVCGIKHAAKCQPACLLQALSPVAHVSCSVHVQVVTEPSSDKFPLWWSIAGRHRSQNLQNLVQGCRGAINILASHVPSSIFRPYSPSPQILIYSLQGKSPSAGWDESSPCPCFPLQRCMIAFRAVLWEA